MKRNLDFLLCAAAICVSVYALAMYCIFHGPKSFTYFTTISIILVPLAMIWRIAELLSKKDSAPSNAYCAAKFVATLSIAVTFLVYLVILAPTNAYGFFGAYKTFYCASLCAHVVSPLLTIVHFFAFDQKTIEKSRLLICSIAYPLLYCIAAFSLGPLFGLRWNGGKNTVPYNFLNYKAPCGWFGFELGHMDSTTIGIGVAYVLLALTLVFLGVGRLLWAIKAKAK